MLHDKVWGMNTEPRKCECGCGRDVEKGRKLSAYCRAYAGDKKVRCLLCGVGRRSRGYGVCRVCFRKAVKETIEGLLERQAKVNRGEWKVEVPMLYGEKK